MGLIYAIILIGVLIFVHELGHFLVAKAFDVKVLRFSIGFGPRIVSFKRGETEYMICALPLGGYVQMLGMDFAGAEEVPEHEKHRALMMKPIWQRSLVVLAGPFFNIVFPILCYFAVTMSLATTPPSIVGDVFDDMPAAAAGLQPGDRIVRIDGEPVDYWYQVIENVTTAPGERVELAYERDGEIKEVVIVPEAKSSTDFLGLRTQSYGLIGIHPGTYGSTLGVNDPESPAARAGLRTFDRVLSVGDKAIKRYDQFEAAVRASGGEPLTVVALRQRPITVDYGRLYQQEPVEVTLQPVKIDGVWSAGTRRAEMFLAEVGPNSPAAKAGLQIGDEILAAGPFGPDAAMREFSNWRMMSRELSNVVNEGIVANAEQGLAGQDFRGTFQIRYRRGEQVLETALTPYVIKFGDQDIYKMQIGWGHVSNTVYPDEVAFPLGMRAAYAAEFAVEQTWEFVRMTVMSFVRMSQGRLSLNNVGGPIMIADLAAQAGDAGWERFLEMMALISINLGIINLLPIPILDGGNLMLFAIEAVKRGPLSFRTRQIAAYIGFTLIIFLVVLAFKNDIERQWDNIATFVNEI